MNISFQLKLAMALIVGVLGLMFTGLVSANSTAGAVPSAVQRATDTCPPPFNNGYICQFKPADETSSTETTTKAHTKIVIKSSSTANIRTFEKTTGKRVVIYDKPSGASSVAGCVNPIAKGWIKNNGQFSNTGGVTNWRFWSKWKAGWKICNPHREQINGQWYMVGKKLNCDNDNIWIPLGPVKKHTTYPSAEFSSVSSFMSTFEKFVDKYNKTTTTKKSNAWCNPGWTLTYISGKPWCFIAVQVPAPSPPCTTCNPPVVVPPPPIDVCPNISGVQTSIPNGYIKDSAGNCVIPPSAPCTPAPDRNQYDKCVSPCPPTESRFTRPAQAEGYGWIPSGTVGLYYSVWYNPVGNGFWGDPKQIPNGAVTGNSACYKPAPGTGGTPPPPPSP